MLSETDQIARWLRRYNSQQRCPSGAYHSATSQIANINRPAHIIDDDYWSHDDTRWPIACPCGYRFRDNDGWQLFTLRLFTMPDGSSVVLHDSPPSGVTRAPPGAMWFSSWCPGPKKHAGPYLWVMVPDGGGAWCIDGSSDNGPGWDRVGEPPNVTVTPSILCTGKYHGWLMDGEFNVA